MFSGPSRLGLLHCDPHHGNFRLQPDGRVGMLDFGAVTPMPPDMLQTLGRLVRLVADNRRDALFALMRSEGFIPDGARISGDDLLAFLGSFVHGLRGERFHFSRGVLEREGGRMLDFRGDFKTVQALNLPPQYLMFLRTAAGWTGILSQIDCTVPARSILQKWIPGFADTDQG